MRTAVIVLALLVACTGRTAQDTETSTAGTTEPGNTSDPTSPTTPTTGELDNPSGFCSPFAQDPAACPTDYVCCSDDPATTQGRLPNYFGQAIDETFGEPIFSGDRNALSHSGQCVDLGFASPLANGCPVPCNPTWTQAQVATICGVGLSCCAFRTVDPDRDCVLDPQTSRWRSVRGSDIGGLSKWGSAHSTNQDPLGESCIAFATVDGVPVKERLDDCFDQLSVADQRGFCYQGCACAEDLCDMKNPDWVPRCGA